MAVRDQSEREVLNSSDCMGGGEKGGLGSMRRRSRKNFDPHMILIEREKKKKEGIENIQVITKGKRYKKNGVRERVVCRRTQMSSGGGTAREGRWEEGGKWGCHL